MKGKKVGGVEGGGGREVGGKKGEVEGIGTELERGGGLKIYKKRRKLRIRRLDEELRGEVENWGVGLRIGGWG